jgi:NADH:ubiquinone oxidoreductase subunit H
VLLPQLPLLLLQPPPQVLLLLLQAVLLLLLLLLLLWLRRCQALCQLRSVRSRCSSCGSLLCSAS